MRGSDIAIDLRDGAAFFSKPYSAHKVRIVYFQGSEPGCWR